MNTETKHETAGASQNRAKIRTYTHRYTYKQLSELPTIEVGQFDNLKLETSDTRVWLSRCGIADGLKYNYPITVERLINGVWTTVYEGKKGIRI